MIEQLQERLAVWKRKYLPKGGRRVLIKSTIESLRYTCYHFCGSEEYFERNGDDCSKFSLGNFNGKEEVLPSWVEESVLLFGQMQSWFETLERG